MGETPFRCYDVGVSEASALRKASAAKQKGGGGMFRRKAGSSIKMSIAIDGFCFSFPVWGGHVLTIG